ncbi:hypothetical protein MKK67_23765 [Methylobacterium sp. J-072]|uniref:hypothetical protein n=1 Tax=Methylobacterium sp. J-072 TaxID=2836651 RepID=UPI001FBB1AE6|nr:hypothetical protein [Methylobacterium sp. J-072]MCJ2095492.1 hypothetical protein [Methylobacterium sp. J-072]
MAAAEQHVDEYVFRYTTEGVDQSKAKVDALGTSLDKLTTSQDRSAASNDKGSAASDRAARATAMREAAAAKAQRQLDMEARALAQVQMAQDAVAASAGGLTAAQERAASSAAAVQKAANDNSAALGKQSSVYAEVGKAAAAHPILVLATSVAAARALAGLATSAAGYLGIASAAIAAFAEGSTAMGGAVAAGGALAARGLAVAGEAATVVAGGLAAYAAKVEGATTGVGLLVGALRLIPPAFVPIAAAFAAFQLASAVIGKAYDDLQKLIDLGTKAQALDIGAPFLKSFEAVGSKIGATTDQIDTAISKASSFLKMNWGQDNNSLSKVFNDITATGAAGADGLKSTALADTAATTQDRIKAAIAGMKELDDLGLHLASIQVGEKVFGPEFVERLRISNTSAEQLSTALEAAAEKEVLKQEQVDRALALNKNISDTKQAIADAWAVNIDFSAAATLLNQIWLSILQAVLSVVQAMNTAIEAAEAFGAKVLSAVGGAFSAVAGQVSGLLQQLGVISKQSEQAKQDVVASPPTTTEPKITGRDLGYISTVVDGRKPDTAGAKQAKQAAQEAVSSYDTLIKRTQDHIDELNLEADSVGKDAGAVIKLKRAHDLARAAQKDGTEVTAEMRAEWDKLGDTLATSTINLQKSKLAFEGIKDGQRELASDFTSFIEDITVGGQKMDEAFKSLAKTLSSSALKAIISGEGPLAGILGTASDTRGQLGGLLGGNFNLSSLFGGGSNAAGSPLPGAQGPSLPSSSLFGGLFDGDKISSALGLGAESGIGKALGDALKPQKAGGGILSSQLGQGLVSVGAGASIGYSSQSPLMGALGGGLAGLASGDPILAIAGAGAGAIGSIPSSKKDRRHVARQRLRDLA